jgi:pimeloyl-ACP methyl ester carboxylesterase
MRRPGLVAAMVLLALAGCAQPGPARSHSAASGSAHSSPTVAAGPSPSTDPPCAGSPPVRVLSVRNDNEKIPVELLGTGRVTVILSNQSDEDRCSWLPFAGNLVARGFRVALWEYAMYPATDELSAIVPAVHRDGRGGVILMGASKGAKTSLIVARGRAEPFVKGVVSLSAESVLQPGVDVARATAGLTVATLLVTARDDPYGSADALTSIRHGLTRAQVVRVPGSDHGTALLTNARVSSAVLGFIKRVSP